MSFTSLSGAEHATTIGDKPEQGRVKPEGMPSWKPSLLERAKNLVTSGLRVRKDSVIQSDSEDPQDSVPAEGQRLHEQRGYQDQSLLPIFTEQNNNLYFDAVGEAGPSNFQRTEAYAEWRALTESQRDFNDGPHAPSYPPAIDSQPPSRSSSLFGFHRKGRSANAEGKRPRLSLSSLNPSQPVSTQFRQITINPPTPSPIAPLAGRATRTRAASEPVPIPIRPGATLTIPIPSARPRSTPRLEHHDP